MERQQAGQEEALVEVRVETDSLEADHRPRGSGRRGCFKCAVALATVMGLIIVALVVVFTQFFMPPCDQDSQPLNCTAKCYITCKKSDTQGRYDILTVNKTGTYLIYGEVKSVTSEEVILMQKRNTITPIQTKKNNDGDVFFSDRVKMYNGTSISINFESTSPDSCRFLVYEL